MEGELKEVPVKFASAKIVEPGRETQYYPFWVLRAEVSITSRSATGGFFSSIFGKEGTGGQVSFYIPGFDAPLEVLKKLSMDLTRGQPTYEAVEGRGKPLKGCVHSEQFAKGFADFVFLSMEAEKPDKMKSISYSIKFLGAEVLAVPFASMNGKRKDLLTGREMGAW